MNEQHVSTQLAERLGETVEDLMWFVFSHWKMLFYFSASFCFASSLG